MSDLVARLRQWSVFGYGYEASCTMKEAATAIEAQYANMANAARLLSEQTARIERLEAEVKVWVNRTKTAVWSDSEECKMLTRINAALLEAPTVDIDVVVPDRDYSAMTPKDCYEAGLLDGVYQAREAIKAVARAALGEEKKG